MTSSKRDPDPHDVPGFDRALGIDEPVSDAVAEARRMNRRGTGVVHL